MLETATEELADFVREHLNVPVHRFVDFGGCAPASTSVDRIVIEAIHLAPFGGAVASGDRVILTIAARVHVIMRDDIAPGDPPPRPIEASFMADIEATAIRTETGYSHLLWMSVHPRKLTVVERIGNFLDGPA